MRKQFGRLFQNSALLFGLNLMVRVSNAFLFWLLARRDPDQAGVFTVALSYTLVVEALSLWGLDQLLIRDVARDRDQAARIFPRYIGLRFLLSVAGMLICGLIIISTSAYSGLATLTILLLVLTVFTEGFNDMCLALFVALDWLRKPVWMGIVVACLRLGLASALILSRYSLITLMLCLVGLSGLLATLNGLFLRLLQIRVLPVLEWPLLRQLFIVAAPLGLINVLWALDSQSGSVLMSYQLSKRTLAHYGAVTTVLSGLQLLPAAVQMSLFPPLTRLFHRDRAAFWMRYEQLQRLMAFIGTGVAVGVVIMAPVVIRVIFGSAYQASVGPLQIMGLAIILYFITIPDSRAMIITNQLWRIVAMLLVSLLFNWLVVAVALERFGLYAVTSARVLSLTLFFLLNHAVVSRSLHRFPLWRIMWQPALAGLGAVGFWQLTRPWPWINYGLTLVVYLLLGIALLGIAQDDRRWLQQMFKRVTPTNSLEQL